MSIKEEFYQPDPTEFHIGFEFQFLTGGTEWKTFILDNNRIERVFENLRDHPEMFRVKRLSKDCIESLGWTFEKQHPGLEDMTFSKKHGREDLTLDTEEDDHIRIYEFYQEGDLNYFFGDIKNKSELQKLMSQLGI